MNPSCFSYTSLNSLVYAEGEPRIFLDFPINYWIHSCSNFSQHHFQSTPEGAFFYTVYFCDFFFLNLSKVFRTLKGHVKNQGRTIYRW